LLRQYSPKETELLLLSHYQQAITLLSDFAQTYNNMGSALVVQGRFEEAIVNFEQAINFDSHYGFDQKKGTP
jgi:Tfp pilus assembly protein PilF